MKTPKQTPFPYYRKLLRLYPAAYYDKYADQMLQTLEDMAEGAETRHDRAAIRLRAALDLPLSITKQQLLYTGGVMHHDMPHYIKASSLAGAVLLLPFFLFVVIDSLSNHSLNRSFFWHTPVLFTWIIVLPAIAVILNAAALSRWVYGRGTTTGKGFWRRLLDIRHDWPLLAVAIVALGIIGLALFHDSVHCITGNPVRELRNTHQTLQCIQQR